MNDYQFRAAMRDQEINRIKLRKDKQSKCLHARGGILYSSYENNRAFCFLKLPTGETIGTCLYCQKIISSIDPRDREIYLDAIEKLNKTHPVSNGMIAESGQFLVQDNPEDKLFKQLARFTPEEKERI